MSGSSQRPMYVGIDLGTTNSTACVFDGENVHLVRNSQGSSLTPSVVRIDSRGQVTVGSRARRFLDTDPKNTRAEFKRLMGTEQMLDFAAAKLKKRPEELAAEVLRSLRSDVQEQFGFVPERAVISVPALFELPQTSATWEAARLAGFERVEMIQEPVASALSAGWSADDAGGAWLVYDLGGGTFDASLLETRDGLLRVIGHDGDNFLGGRDFDQALVDWALEQVTEQSGVSVDRANPANAAGLRRLKAAAEDAKIDLTRSTEAVIAIPSAFEVDGAPVDVDVVVARDTLERLVRPLIDRSLNVCLRLLATHGLGPEQLSRVVLVGGPTVMPAVRRRVGEVLGASFTEGHDPMTLVAQGASIYAATAGLDARAAVAATVTAGRKFWLQYPAMSSDLSPHVAGRLLAAGSGPVPTQLRLVRADGGWSSPACDLDAEGGFVMAVDLAPRKSNLFELRATTADGAPVSVEPATIAIVQGMTITDPPLSRTVGVALASDQVHVYLERGAPLPAKRTFAHYTVDSVARGVADMVLRIPIVQGEYEQAHLCRLVGTLEIGGKGLENTLPAGSLIEVTIEVDRGGRLSARAFVPQLGQVFEQVAHLLVPDAAPEQMTHGVADLRKRLQSVRASATQRGLNPLLDRLFDVEWSIGDVERDIQSARGGDADAGQKAKRLMLELDAKLDELEAELRWPELEDQSRATVANASHWVSVYGTAHEQQLLTELTAAVERARRARQPVELQRQLRMVRDVSTAARFRDPNVWSTMFQYAASDIGNATDLRKAEGLVRDGRAAMARNDPSTLRSITEQLWRLLPSDASSKKLSFDSGLR
jgi:molecular chaperone DnaK